MYLFFTKPQPLSEVAPFLLRIAGRFNLVSGHTFFGDLFLRNSATGEYAIVFAATLELVETGEVDEKGLREQILANSEVVKTLLRPEEALVLVERLGPPAIHEAFFPVPLPALGGMGALPTFQRGGLWEYLGIVACSMGS